MSAEAENKKSPTESVKIENDEKLAPDSVNAGEQIEKPERMKSDSKMCLIERGVTGKVMWYSPFKGFGFISRNDEQPDVFVHSSAIVRINRYTRVLTEEEEVEFDVVRGHKGPEAAAVTGKGGKVIHAYTFRVGQTVRVAGAPNYYRNRRNEANGLSRKAEDKEVIAEGSASSDDTEDASTGTTSSSSSSEDVKAQEKNERGDVKPQPSLKSQNAKDAKPQAPIKSTETQSSPQQKQQAPVKSTETQLSPPQKPQNPKVEKPKTAQDSKVEKPKTAQDSKTEKPKTAQESKGKQPPAQKDSKTDKAKTAQKQAEQKVNAAKADK